MEQDKDKLDGQGATPFAQTYFHGTRSDLKVGDLIEVCSLAFNLHLVSWAVTRFEFPPHCSGTIVMAHFEKTRR